jgi:predicted permease
VLTDLLCRLRAIFHRTKAERDLDDEFRLHLDYETAKLMRTGLSQDEAGRRARIGFGGVEQFRERCRDARGVGVWDAARQDLRFGWRALRRNPGFALTAIATLALGIAVNTTIFSVVNGVLLRPLPYREANRLALLWTTNPRRNAFERPTGLLNVLDWRAARSFEAMAWFRDEPVVLEEEPEPEPMNAVFVSPDFFGILGARPALGRFFTGEEAARGDCLAVLSYGLWQRRFGGSPDVLGRVVRIEARRATVVGVLPADFRPLVQSAQVWMPDTSASFFADLRASREPKFGWSVIARLRSGVNVAQAQTEMNGIAARLAAAWPGTNRDSGARVISLLDQVTGHVRLALMLMQVAVALVLLIACFNLGNLMMARATGREREMAVRAITGCEPVAPGETASHRERPARGDGRGYGVWYGGVGTEDPAGIGSGERSAPE